MRIQGNYAEQSTFHLRYAFLIYASEDQSVATQHHVVADPKTERPVLSAGVPASRAALEEAIKALREEKATERRSLIEEHVLIADPDMLLWWRPSQRRTIFFQTGNAETDKLNGRAVLHPALLFMARAGMLFAFALRKDARPTEDTLLFHAPYMNLYENGHMCEGTYRLPRHYRTEGIGQWEAGFFDTSFVHTHLAMKKVTRYRGGHLGLWTEMAKRTTRVFPASALTPMFTPGDRKRSKTDVKQWTVRNLLES